MEALFPQIFCLEKLLVVQVSAQTSRLREIFPDVQSKAFPTPTLTLLHHRIYLHNTYPVCLLVYYLSPL